LLFVAISVAADRLERDTDQVHRVRAAAALSAFTNSLTVSLFALTPGHPVGWTSFIVALIGLLFIGGSLLSISRTVGLGRERTREAAFLISLLVTLVVQLITGIELIEHPHDSSPVQTIATLVVVCFLIGIGRSWELVGGPEIGLFHEVWKRRKGNDTGSDDEPAT
jgi:hypothetical protein